MRRGAAALLALAVQTAVGADLYVDVQNGDDSWAGTTPTNALRTIQRAAAGKTGRPLTAARHES